MIKMIAWTVVVSPLAGLVAFGVAYNPAGIAIGIGCLAAVVVWFGALVVVAGGNE